MSAAEAEAESTASAPDGVPAGDPETAASAAQTRPTAGTRGFLFSDLRGYTAFVERHGDAAAADLLATYRDLVRGVIATYTGAEIRTEGDSFYVVFPNASAGVEAGLAIVAAAAERSTPEHPLRVGVGVHAGETVETTEGLVGGAVNIAARVCAQAEAGEVLITDTVRALTRTFLPYRYTSLGPQQLKGIAGRMRLYRVDANPSTRAARLRRQLAARRGRIAVALGLVVVVAAAGAALAVTLSNRAPDCLTLPDSTANVVAKVDPLRNCVIAVYPVGRRPTLAMWVGDRVWVLNSADLTVTALSADGDRLATVGIPTVGTSPNIVGGDLTQNVSAFAGDGTDLWVVGRDGVTRISLATADVVAAYGLPTFGEVAPPALVARAREVVLPKYLDSLLTDHGGPYGIAASPGRVWISFLGWPWVLPFDTSVPAGLSNAFEAQTLLRFDLNKDALVTINTGEGLIDRRGTIGFPPGSGLVTLVGRSLWVALQSTPDVVVVNLDSSEIATFKPAGASGYATTIATNVDDVWVGYSNGQVAHGLRSRPEAVVTAVQLAQTISGMASGPSALWVSDAADRELYRLVPNSLTVEARISTGGRAEGVAVAPDGSVWVAIGG